MNEVSTLHIISCHKDDRAIYGHGHRRSDANSPDVILCGWLGSKHQLLQQSTYNFGQYVVGLEQFLLFCLNGKVEDISLF